MEEISAENLAELEKRYKVTVFIVSAQIFSALILLIVGWFMIKDRDAVSEGSFLTLWLPVLFISAGTFVMRRRLYNWESLKNTSVLKGIRALIRLLQTNAIVLYLFIELVIMIGFFIAVASGNFLDLLRVAGIGLILFAINFPRLSVWKKIVLNLEKA
jgi:hypothetical protein